MAGYRSNTCYAGIAQSAGAQQAAAPLQQQGQQFSPSDMMGSGMMGMMGNGMMGPMMMSGPMNPNMMVPMMMYGPMMGCNANPSAVNLTIDNVKAQLEQWLAWQNNPRLKLGSVKEKDANTIVAEIVTKDNSLVQQFSIDRHTGAYRQN